MPLSEIAALLGPAVALTALVLWRPGWWEHHTWNGKARNGCHRPGQTVDPSLKE